MSKIDDLLRLLLDGKWHTYTEIAQKLNINHQKLENIIELLKEFDFIQQKENMARILPDTEKLVKTLKPSRTGIL
ncbi:MAG: hypothetical protein ACPL4K_06155 [Candidatus Margulisiibacteriota bacterium]|jgi:predicted transcriptional regulator